ncbi:MAG: DUF2254 domain-containing protein [Alphaproteobacteria bacterium]
MSGRVFFLFDRIVSSFWFLPIAMAAAAVLLFFGTISLDGNFEFARLDDMGPPFSIGSDGARQLLSTIAGALITVASLVFSMTLVALTLAAGNIGARLLLRYMRNRTIKITLGLLLGSFVYSLLALSATGDSADQVPSLTVFCAMIFSIVSFLWLVYAFHDLAEAIQVDRAVGNAGKTLKQAMLDLIDAGDGQGPKGSVTVSEPEGEPSFTMESRESAYVQTIDRGALVALAGDHDVVIALHRRPGSFAMSGEHLASVFKKSAKPSESAIDEIESCVRAAVVLGPMRTDTGDPFFCMRLLNEIAARALSASMNDQYTAMICIDQMIDALALTLNGALPDGYYYDDDGALRLVLTPYAFEDLLAGAVDDLRRNAVGQPSVAIRLIDRLCRLAAFAENAEERQAITSHALATMEQACERALSDYDRRRIEESFSPPL